MITSHTPAIIDPLAIPRWLTYRANLAIGASMQRPPVFVRLSAWRLIQEAIDRAEARQLFDRWGSVAGPHGSIFLAAEAKGDPAALAVMAERFAELIGIRYHRADDASTPGATRFLFQSPRRTAPTTSPATEATECQPPKN